MPTRQRGYPGGFTELSSSSDDHFREMFYEEARELLISLEEGLMDLERRQGDRAHLDKTFRAAHSLKGAVDNFVARAAYEAALRLETLGRNGNLAGAEEAYTELEKEMNRLLPVLANLANRRRR